MLYLKNQIIDMVEGLYNKHTAGGGVNGTLIGNWQEERAMREFTGVGR